MDHKRRLAVFYSFEDIDMKDIETEIFTEDKKEKFQFYFFHNMNLHFSKTTILKEELLKIFGAVEPEFYFDVDTHRYYMQKIIKDFSFNEFDQRVDDEFDSYLKRINYRIDCVIQTFTLFFDLYKDKDMIFVFPMQLHTRFLETIEELKFSYTDVSKLDKVVSDYDLFHWLHYYTKQHDDQRYVKPRNIIRIIDIKK